MRAWPVIATLAALVIIDLSNLGTDRWDFRSALLESRVASSRRLSASRVENGTSGHCAHRRSSQASSSRCSPSVLARPTERLAEAEENLRVYLGVGPVGKEVVVPIERRKKR